MEMPGPSFSRKIAHVLRVAAAAALGLSIFVSAACNVLQEPDYAGPIAEGILQALDRDDYDGYRKDFDETMLAVVTREAFDQTHSLVKGRAGDYVSKEYWKTELRGVYFAVLYRAKYTLEPADVIVTVVFAKEAEGSLVTGLWFDSPELRK
jgi:hypothetical protein